MKKYSLLPVLFSCCITTAVSAQDSLQFAGKIPNGITIPASPLITVKAEEISRFPTTNFLDAVEGLFPWVYGSGQQAGNFSFIVNGTLMSDISSISLQDVEEISFTRDNMCTGLLPLAKAGTFFIKTKAGTGKLRVNFSSQYNIVSNGSKPFLGKDSYIYGPGAVIQSNTIGNGEGNFWANHLSVRQGGEKYDWYAGAFFNHNRLPGMQQDVKWKQGVDTIQATEYALVKERLQQYSLFAAFNLKISPTLKVGVMANYAAKNVTADSSLLSMYATNEYNEMVNSKPGFKTFTVSAYLEWKPFLKMVNRLSAEYVSYKYEEEENGRRTYTSSISTGGKLFTSSAMQKNTALLLRHQLQYTFIRTKRIEAGADINSVFHKPWYESASNYVSTFIENPGIPNFTRSFSKYNRKFLLVNPAFYLSYNNMLTAYAGAGYFFGTIKTGDTKLSDRLTPYAGINFDLKNILHVHKGIDNLQLSVNYAEINKSTWSLPQFNYGQQASSQPVFSTNIMINPNVADMVKDRFLAVNLTTGFFNNKLMISAEYSRLLYDKIFISHINSPNSVDILFMGSEVANGTSFLLSAKTIDKKDWKLSSRLSVLFPKVQSQLTQTWVTGYINETATRAGLQNRLAYKNYFLQVNALLYLDQYYSDGSTTDKVKKSDFAINYALLGCRLTGVKGIFKNSTVYVQARNIFVSKYLKEKYWYNRLAGIGVELAF